MEETAEVFTQAHVALTAALANGLGPQATLQNGPLRMQTVVVQPKTSKKSNLVASARIETKACADSTAMIVAGPGKLPTNNNGKARVPAADARNGGVLEIPILINL